MILSGILSACRSQGDVAVAFAMRVRPYIKMLLLDDSGFGTVYPDPWVLPTGAVQTVSFSPSGKALAASHFNEPALTIYRVSPIGFGSVYANPSVPPAYGSRASAFSPSGKQLAVTDEGGYARLYAWDDDAGFGVALTNPAVRPNNLLHSVSWHPDETALVIGCWGEAACVAYAISESGIGVRFANPATLLGSDGTGAAFAPDGQSVVVTCVSSPYCAEYAWSESGFGTKLASVAMTGIPRAPVFSPDGSLCSFGALQSSFDVYAYQCNGQLGAEMSAGYAAAYAIESVAFTPDSKTLITTAAGGYAHRISPAGFGAAYANPSASLGASLNHVSTTTFK